MTQIKLKRTDEEWFALINDCRTSGLKVKVWCEQHSITSKALYYHTNRLREKGYDIPQTTAAAVRKQKQEVVCLDIPDERSFSVPAQASPVMRVDSTAAVCITFRGIHIKVSNHAAQDIITNTFHALQELC